MRVDDSRYPLVYDGRVDVRRPTPWRWLSSPIKIPREGAGRHETRLEGSTSVKAQSTCEPRLIGVGFHHNYAVQAGLPREMAWYVDAAGSLDVAGLIAAFQTFFREHSEHWVQRFERYREAGPQLLLQAHLQRIVNGGGQIEREYALGSGRTDLLIEWLQGGSERRWVVE